MRAFSLLILIAFVVGLIPAQVKPLHFKVLQESLPSKAFKGFDRKKPTGKSNTTMGMSMSEASVEYEQPFREGDDVPPAVNVKIQIQDMVGMPYAMMPYTMMQEYENETEDGYEKTVTVKGKYKGTENARTGDYKSIKTTFAVANRFIVEVEIDHSDDAKLLADFVNAVDVAKLEKAVEAK